LNGGFGFRNVFALDRIDPKAKEASKSFLSGTEADVALHEGNVTRKVKNGIARKVVRLESIKIQELAKEVGGRKAEAALKMRKENDELTGFEYRFNLVARKPAGNFCRYPPGTVQPINFMLRHIGAFPGSAGDTG
jgi:ribosomal protein S24E